MTYTKEDIENNWLWFIMIELPTRIGKVVRLILVIVIGIPLIMLGTFVAGVFDNKSLKDKLMNAMLKND